ncbi:FUN14 domain-containing protein 1-like [Saccoglossus kowalevskii]|uniref:FUN14 domain-containing protein 1-like n=1 Tax=Saccoglossus kowalevskii TaxID=10224 RepID=A0ABM0MD54_SACKO|nr:PREDICTED: FUN14 domain-containing protein 1-like [Saccoglossus kowalevskii]
MADGDSEPDDEHFEIIDLTRERRNEIIEKVLGDVTTKGAMTQLAIGGSTGWFVGYVFQKVGRAAATAVGGGLIIMRVAHYGGYIKIDWRKVEKDVDKAQRKLTKNARKLQNEYPEMNGYLLKLKQLCQQNVMLTSGFIGGFLLGMAF